MSKKEKLLEKLFTRPRNFEWDDLVTLLNSLGFETINKKSVRYKFYHPEIGRKLSFHKPHPESTIKSYVIDQTIEYLEELGVTP